MQIQVLAETEAWRVVAKPAGMPVHRSAMVSDKHTLMRHVRRQWGDHVAPVHRLDRPTSGCLLMSNATEHTPVLQDALGQGEKRYLAFVRGRITSMDPIRYKAPMKDPDGVEKDAETLFEPIAASAEPRCSLVLCTPLTGRWHQIRRHLRDLSHPILGDSTHGDTRVNRTWREQHGLHRLALHCLSLGLDLPDGARVDATCPLPSSLRTVFSAMPWWEEAVARIPTLAVVWDGVEDVVDG